MKAAERHGLAGWQHDAENDSIRNGDHVINLANIHLEYAAAILRRLGCSGIGGHGLTEPLHMDVRAGPQRSRESEALRPERSG